MLKFKTKSFKKYFIGFLKDEEGNLILNKKTNQPEKTKVLLTVRHNAGYFPQEIKNNDTFI